MRNRYTPSNAVASLRVKGRENQQASSAQIALGAKAMVSTGQARSSQYFTHTARNLGSTNVEYTELVNCRRSVVRYGQQPRDIGTNV